MQNTKPHSNEVQSGPESSLTSAIWDKRALLLLNSQFTLQPPTAPFPPLSGHLTTLSTFPAVLTMHPHTPSPLPKRLPFVVNRLITFVSQQAAQEVSWSVLLSFCFSSIQSQFKGKKRSHQLLKETYSLLWSQFSFFIYLALGSTLYGAVVEAYKNASCTWSWSTELSWRANLKRITDKNQSCRKNGGSERSWNVILFRSSNWNISAQRSWCGFVSATDVK